MSTTPTKTPPFVSGALPVLGHALEFARNRPALIQRGYQEHGEVFAIRLARQNVAIVVGPENQKQFFSETDKRLGIQEPYQFLRAMFGDVLFIAPHEEYLAQRPLVQAMFRREKMMLYTDIMLQITQQWLDSLGERGEFEVSSTMARLAQDIAGTCFLGPTVQARVGREFWDLYDDLGRSIDPLLPPNLPLPKFRRRDRARARMLEILQPIIAERRAQPDAYDDVLQEMIMHTDRNGKLVDQQVVLNLLLGLMFAGHETTAGQAAWTIILLLQHPDYLARVQQEIAQTAPDGQVGPRALTQMAHIGWAVREVERLRPSAEMVMRMVREPIEFGDYVLPAGWLVQTAHDISHMLPTLFRDPQRFDPLRFAPERAEDKASRFALAGFGGGMHKCTGMNFANLEMTIITALLFQQFDLALVTLDPGIERGMGANRPQKTVIRYWRKQAQPAAVAPDVVAA